MDLGRIKIQTLNLWHHEAEYQLRLKTVARRLQVEQPDIICLQEVIFWPDGSNTAEFLATESGMTLVSAMPESNNSNPTGTTPGNAILSTLPMSEHGHSSLIPNLDRDTDSNAVWFWTLTPNGNPLLVITTHLSWGVFNEYQRLQEAIDINALAKDLTKDIPDALVVLAGTMNTTPESDTVRFLTGLMALEGADNFWIDCWAETEDGLGETQTPRNVWMRVMAAEAKTQDTTRLPKRRIDYIFVRDWVYGQTGSPISTKIAFAEPLGTGSHPDAPVSDHYGVETILLDLQKL